MTEISIKIDDTLAMVHDLSNDLECDTMIEYFFGLLKTHTYTSKTILESAENAINNLKEELKD